MGDALMVAVPLVTAAALVGLGSRRVGRRDLERFAARFGMVVEGSNEIFVAGRLRRSRALRSTAVALGFVVGGLPAYMNFADRGRAGDFAIAPVHWAWLFGAAVAAVAAEVLVVQRPVHGGRAVLSERLPEHYISPRWIRLATALAGAALAFFLVAVLGTDHGLLGPVTGAAGALVTLGAVTLGLRRIADRPRLDMAGRLLGLDDALRAHGAHHVVGAAVALSAVSLVLTSGPLFDEVAPALNLVTVLLTYAAFGAWYNLAQDEPWRVRTPEEPTP